MKFFIRNFALLVLTVASPAFASLQLLDPQIYKSEIDYLRTRTDGRLLETNIGEISQNGLTSLIESANLSEEDAAFFNATNKNTFENDFLTVNLQWKAFGNLHNGRNLQQLGLIAYTNPFFTRDNNVYAQENFGGTAAQLYFQVSKYFSFDIKPYLLLHDAPGTNHFFLKEMYGSLHLNRLSLDVGRMRLHWGYGAYQPMAFSDDMEPFYMVLLRNNEEFDFLDAKTNFEIFYGWLDKYRTYPNGNIIGSTFSFQPNDRLHFHFTETVLYGGDGAPSNSPFLFYTELFVSGRRNPANRNSSVGLRYRIPEIEIEPYMDIYIEDCCKNMVVNSRDMLNLIGLYLPPKDSGRKFDLAVEWVRTNQITYRHEAYPYTQSRKIMGHPIGPDASGVYGVSRYFQSKKLQFETIVASETRGTQGRALSNQGYIDIRTIEPTFQANEQRYRLEEFVDYFVNPAWKITLHLGIEKINHYQYQTLAYRMQGIFGLESSYNF